jgi:putative acetyltransferase
MPQPLPVSLELAAAPTHDVRALVAELEDELAQDYPPEQRHGLALDALFQPHIRFFVARQGGAALACGGVALLGGFAEVKRMYVRPSARGLGLADALMARIAETALAEGRTILRLETGNRALAAIGFYRRSGFAPCPPFAPYTQMPPHSIATSIFLEKRLGVL